MTAAQTLDVVHGLVNNMQVVMDGTYRLLVLMSLCTIYKSGRWEGIDRRHPREPWCVQLTFAIKARGFFYAVR
jgi:hypothetical protein